MYEDLQYADGDATDSYYSPVCESTETKFVRPGAWFKNESHKNQKSEETVFFRLILFSWVLQLPWQNKTITQILTNLINLYLMWIKSVGWGVTTMDPQNIPNSEKKSFVHKPSPCVGVASALLMTGQHHVFPKNIEIQNYYCYFGST